MEIKSGTNTKANPENNPELAKLSKHLEKRGFDVHICSDKNEAANKLLDIVRNSGNKNPKLGFGNSETIRSINFIEKVSPYTSEIYVHDPLADTADADMKALSADFYFSSANAVSKDGQIVNIDGTGNRTAATCFGPKHVIFVIGKNKICATLENAIERARNVAAVGIAKKYKRNTPCVHTGKCEDCQSPQCVCGVMTVHRRQLHGNKITIILVDEDLGI